MEQIKDAARLCLSSGLSVIPARKSEKRPLVSWKTYQENRAAEADVDRLFAMADAIGIVCGAVSGNVEMIDFDMAGEAFAGWCKLVRTAAPGLLERLAIEYTPSGGRHVVYRVDSEIPGNQKLAERRIECENGSPVQIGSKPYTPRHEDGRWLVTVTLIETRGEGGMFLAAPTADYTLVQGGFDQLPVLSMEERDVLIGLASMMSEVARPIEDHRQIGVLPSPTIRPGDDFNARGDIRPHLLAAGWSKGAKAGGNEHWRRPGKDRGTSATLKDGVFYCFSSEAAPFSPNRGYSQFAVYALLEHSGDYTAAAAALGVDGYGGQPNLEGVDLSLILEQSSSSQDESGVSGGPISYRVLVASHPEMRPVVIDGILRRGETMNLISAPKVGKSWLTLDLACAIATGGAWLDRYRCERGRVLILDNELHRETSAARLPKVVEARGIDERDLNETLWIDNLRGRLLDFRRIGAYLSTVPEGWFNLIILDAFYRFLPVGADENDNGTMSNLYNLIDSWADRLGCCVVLVHHTSKGIQSGKGVTDVGSGAGAQSRATDSHVVLRPHAEDGVVVLEAAVRSFAPVVPVCLRWSFPCWSPDYSLDPTELRGERGSRRAAPQDDGIDMNAGRFVIQFCGPKPTPFKEVIASAIRGGVSERRAKRLLAEAEQRGLVFRRKSPRHTVCTLPD